METGSQSIGGKLPVQGIAIVVDLLSVAPEVVSPENTVTPTEAPLNNLNSQEIEKESNFLIQGLIGAGEIVIGIVMVTTSFQKNKNRTNNRIFV